MPRAAHAARPPVLAAALIIGVIVAVLIIVVAGVAIAFLLKSAGPDKATPTSAQLITVTAVTTPARP
jgi:flagellar basal body-associated protein FliL